MILDNGIWQLCNDVDTICDKDILYVERCEAIAIEIEADCFGDYVHSNIVIRVVPPTISYLMPVGAD